MHRGGFLWYQSAGDILYLLVEMGVETSVAVERQSTCTSVVISAVWRIVAYNGRPCTTRLIRLRYVVVCRQIVLFIHVRSQEVYITGRLHLVNARLSEQRAQELAYAKLVGELAMLCCQQVEP